MRLFVIVSSVVVLAGVAYFLLMGERIVSERELIALHELSPVKGTTLTPTQTWPLPKEAALGSGFTYAPDLNRFYISTDQPHTLKSLFQGRATLVELDHNFNILKTTTIKTGNDLEGCAYIGNGIVYAVDEDAVLYAFNVNNNLELTHTIDLSKRTQGKTRIGSLAYHDGNLYFFDKDTPRKNGYVYNLESDTITSYVIDIPQSFTIAGAVFIKDTLYLFSEAYSTAFPVTPNHMEINLENVLGFANVEECSGIAVQGDNIYLLGDYEDYIPHQKLYRFLWK